MSSFKKVTRTSLIKMKQSGEKIVALTAYDAMFAKQIDEAGVDVILVGDSLGMVIQGHKTTLPVTVDDIIYHTRAVAANISRSLVIADMPFMSYATKKSAIINAARLIKEAGAHMVKLEGGEAQIEAVEMLAKQNIPICAHLGLQPQSIHKLGGYYVQGRDDDSANEMLKDAKLLENAGADCLVLECVPVDLAKLISSQLNIPTIGIGAGPDTDGQILVLYDMLGITHGHVPKFTKNYLVESDIKTALREYVTEVKNKKFPRKEHCFF